MRPVYGVIDASTGTPLLSLVSVILRPFDGVSNQILCTRIGGTHYYRANSDIDENKVYGVYVSGVKVDVLNSVQNRRSWEVTLTESGVKSFSDLSLLTGNSKNIPSTFAVPPHVSVSPLSDRFATIEDVTVSGFTLVDSGIGSEPLMALVTITEEVIVP